MSIENERVVALIRSAFSGVALGHGVGLKQGRGLDSYADAKTLANLRAEDEKDDWQRITVEDLNDYCDTLAFADPAGMRFHLPAFMIADIHGKLRGDIIFHITYVVYVGDDAVSRFADFDTAQRRAVREFLQLRLSRGSIGPERELIEQALDTFWRE